MPEGEKVIKGLECCTQHGSMCGLDCNGYWGWTDGSHTGMELFGEYRTKCPYGNCETGCVKTLAKDAITLLKKSFTPEEVYKTVIEHGQHDKRFKLGDKIDYTFMDVVSILNTELMCKAGDI